jgi:hypothetical protein
MSAMSRIRPWVSMAEAERITYRSRKTIRRLAARGLVRVYEAPGLRRLYFRADLERYAPPVIAATHSEPGRV